MSEQDIMELLRNFAQDCRNSIWQSRDKTIRLMDDGANVINRLRAENTNLKAEVDELREAASNAAMYLKSGFIECPRCGEEVKTEDIDAEYELRQALAVSNDGSTITKEGNGG